MTILLNSADTYSDAALPDANFAQAAKLALSNAGGAVKQAFLYFAQPVPLGAAILPPCNLTVYLGGTWASQTLTVEAITTEWAEDTLTANQAPTITTTHSASATVSGADGDAKNIDISAMLADFAAGLTWLGVRLRVSGTSTVLLYALDHPDQTKRPTLDSEWALPPDPPVDLEPSGGGVVSAAKPTLGWAFGSDDPSADREQTAARVQISTVPDFASIEYDSGTVSMTEALKDLSATAYGGIPGGATRYWRVAVTDSAGQVSAFSDGAEMSFTSQGTLTITAPTNGGVVAETSPTVTWTFTGATQDLVELVLYEVTDDGSLLELWRYPRQVTAGTSIQLFGGPVPLGLQSGKTYEVLVIVWDTASRQVTGGNKDFVSATSTFTYDPPVAGTVAAVTSLAAVPAPLTDEGEESPGVVLTWTHGTSPEGFTLVVDGAEVVDNIAPADVLVSGNTYQMTFYGGLDSIENEFEMQAIKTPPSGPLAGKQVRATGGPKAKATPRITGKWLVDDDPKDPLLLRIAGREQIDLALGESATTYNPIGSRRPIRITDAIRGFEGTISGQLVTERARQRFLDLKGRMKRLRYIQSRVNIPVRLGAISVSPDSSNIGPYFTCSAEIFQVGEFTKVRGLAGGSSGAVAASAQAGGFTDVDSG